MAKIIKLTIIFLLIFNVFSVFALTVSAAGLLPAQTGNSPCPTGTASTTNCGNYSLNNMVSVAVNIATLILKVVGSLALLAFVAGGMMWMLSAGNPEWVTRGKQTIIGAVIGLAIVFTSYMIIQLVYSSLGINWVQYNMTTPLNGKNPSTGQTQSTDQSK